jgi:hypothetical protein
VLHNVKGKVAVSGYKCHLMDELYGDWKVITAPEKVCHSTKGLRTEVLWINYDINTLSQKTLKSQKVETECQHQQLSLMRAFERVINNLTQSLVQDSTIRANVEFVCRNPQNRAGIRLLLAVLYDL